MPGALIPATTSPTCGASPTMLLTARTLLPSIPRRATLRNFRSMSASATMLFSDKTQVRPSLTLTLGLRWEYTTPLREKNNQLSRVVLGQGANTLADIRIVQGGDLSQPDRNNFGPQFGFAWSPAKYGSRMVWRGGFGVAYT